MRILFIGDVVGKVGRNAVAEYLPKLKQACKPTLSIVNVESAVHGKGLTEELYKQLLGDGVDFMTMGNHTYGQREIYDFIDDAKRVIKPTNFSSETPGVDMRFIQVNDIKIVITNLQGRSFMQDIGDPFKKAGQLTEEAKKETNYIFVDFHAETTSEKGATSWYLDGRVSAIVDTYTHIQTSDERILPNGTGYIIDAGMTGYYDGILGINREEVIKRFITSLPQRHVVSDNGRSVFSGVIIDLDKNGRTKLIERILTNGDHSLDK